MKETVYIYGITRRLYPHGPIIEVTASLNDAIQGACNFITESMRCGRHPSTTILKEMVDHDWTFKNFMLCILGNCDGEVLIDMFDADDINEIIFIREKTINLEEGEKVCGPGYMQQ